MDILLSTDKNYIMPTGVTMKSICVNNVNVTFHILIDKKVTENQKQQLENIIDIDKGQSIKFYCLDTRFMDKFPSLGIVKSYITKATYYRLFISDVLPKTVSKVIYLDGDVVNTQSLEKLWSFDISGYAIGAVTDMAEARHDYTRLGYDANKGYFNAGVLFINLDYWREHGLKDKFMDLIVRHPEKIKLHDQDVLNITLVDEKINLPMKYNVQNGFLCNTIKEELRNRYDECKDDLLEAIVGPVLIHFTDNKKPWHNEDCNPYGYEWFKYYKQTEWKYQPLGHCNKSNIRYWGAKILRAIKVLKPAKTYDSSYYTLEEILYLKQKNKDKDETTNIMD